MKTAREAYQYAMEAPARRIQEQWEMLEKAIDEVSEEGGKMYRLEDETIFPENKAKLEDLEYEVVLYTIKWEFSTK